MLTNYRSLVAGSDTQVTFTKRLHVHHKTTSTMAFHDDFRNFSSSYDVSALSAFIHSPTHYHQSTHPKETQLTSNSYQHPKHHPSPSTPPIRHQTIHHPPPHPTPPHTHPPPNPPPNYPPPPRKPPPPHEPPSHK